MRARVRKWRGPGVGVVLGPRTDLLCGGLGRQVHLRVDIGTRRAERHGVPDDLPAEAATAGGHNRATEQSHGRAQRCQERLRNVGASLVAVRWCGERQVRCAITRSAEQSEPATLRWVARSREAGVRRPPAASSSRGRASGPSRSCGGCECRGHGRAALRAIGF